MREFRWEFKYFKLIVPTSSTTCLRQIRRCLPHPNDHYYIHLNYPHLVKNVIPFPKAPRVNQIGPVFS